MKHLTSLMSIQKSIIKLSHIPVQISNHSNCPYIDNKIETRAFVNLSEHPETHDQLAETGFRRVENWAYKPICTDCNKCIPLRVICKSFKPNQNQKRCYSQKLIRNILPCQSNKQHYDLFKKYQKQRHENGLMSKMSWANYSNMINLTPINSMIFEYKSLKGNILGVMLIDIQRDGLSAVYSFYDTTDKKLSIGKYMIIDTINFVKDNKLNYLYLGYFIKENHKMNYKNQFHPYEIYINGKWSKN